MDSAGVALLELELLGLELLGVYSVAFWSYAVEVVLLGFALLRSLC